MQKLALGFALAIGTASVAHAGARYSSTVFISRTADGSGDARGGLGGARNSADNTQDISCAVFSFSSGNPLVICTARDVNNQYLQCSSSVPSIVQIASAIGSDSSIHFYADAQGNCTTLIVSNDSGFEPKR